MSRTGFSRRDWAIAGYSGGITCAVLSMIMSITFGISLRYPQVWITYGVTLIISASCAVASRRYLRKHKRR